MKTKLFVCIAAVLCSFKAFAGQAKCEHEGEIGTPKGKLVEETCRVPNVPGSSKSIWSLDGQPLVSGKYPIQLQRMNSQNSLVVLQGASNSDTGCPDQMFLIDLTGTAPRVFAFGVKNACNEYHWAKWSNKKRSVIALKFNVQFTYLNGKLTPPEDTDGDKFGTPLGYEAPTPATPPTPFVQELVLPKN